MSTTVNVTYQINVNEMEFELNKAIEDAMNELSPLLETYARTHHSYNDKTGRLTNSTLATALKDYLKIEVGASYGNYIHDGTRYISPDPWVENTFKDNEKLIMDTINKHIAIACTKINS